MSTMLYLNSPKRVCAIASVIAIAGNKHYFIILRISKFDSIYWSNMKINNLHDFKYLIFSFTNQKGKKDVHGLDFWASDPYVAILGRVDHPIQVFLVANQSVILGIRILQTTKFC